MRFQATIICPIDTADAARLRANRTVAGIPADPDHEDYVPDDQVPQRTLAEGVPLIGLDDPDDAPVRARAWDLPVRPRYEAGLAAGAIEYGAIIYTRPDEVATMSEAIAKAGFRRSPGGAA